LGKYSLGHRSRDQSLDFLELAPSHATTRSYSGGWQAICKLDRDGSIVSSLHRGDLLTEDIVDVFVVLYQVVKDLSVPGRRKKISYSETKCIEKYSKDNGRKTRLPYSDTQTQSNLEVVPSSSSTTSTILRLHVVGWRRRGQPPGVSRDVLYSGPPRQREEVPGPIKLPGESGD